MQVQPGWLLNLIAGLQATHPNVPLLFAETPKLAGDLAYRWLAAARNIRKQERAATPSRPTRGRTPDAPPAQQPLFVQAQGPDPDAGRHQERADAPLPAAERKHQALQRARVGETLTVRAHAETFHVSPATAGTDLRELADDGLLEAHGNRRSLRYVASGDEGEEP